MNKNLNFEAVKGYHLNLRKLNDDQTKFITENLIKDSRDFERGNNLFHYGFSSPNNEYRFFNFTCFSLGKESEQISFDEFVEKLNTPKHKYDPKDVEFETKCGQTFNLKTIMRYKLIKPEYKEAVSKLIDLTLGDFDFTEKSPFYFTPNSDWCFELKEMKVLDLFFEPVYETSITLKSGVKLSEDDIAEVKEILNNK